MSHVPKAAALVERARQALPRRKSTIVAAGLVLGSLALFGIVHAWMPTGHAPTATPPTPSAAAPRTSQFPLPQLGQSTVVTEDRVDAAARDVKNDLARDIMQHPKSTASFYETPGHDITLVISAPAPVTPSERHLDRLMNDLQRTAIGRISAVDVVASAHPEKLARCGTGEGSYGHATICVWIDPGTYGVAMWFGQSPPDRGSQLEAIREAAKATLP